jgi:hypothetical protein
MIKDKVNVREEAEETLVTKGPLNLLANPGPYSWHSLVVTASPILVSEMGCEVPKFPLVR